jgi:hypothetical protein
MAVCLEPAPKETKVQFKIYVYVLVWQEQLTVPCLSNSQICSPRSTRAPAYLILAALASGSRSITYLRLEIYMMGTPGTLRMRRLSSRSHVATT